MSEQQICGYIERITFAQPDNGFVVAKLQEPRKKELTVIVGTMPSVSPGEHLQCHGAWKLHALHGWQFEVSRFETVRPQDRGGIEKYLGSGMVKGIGPMLAGRIVDVFGLETFDIIETAPERLLEVSGVGRKKLEQILRSWEDQKAIRDLMLFLQPFEVSPSFAQKLFRHYGKESIAKLEEDPFQIAQEVHGIGFTSADKMAKKMGFAADHPRRVSAGIEYVLYELANEGHTCYPVEELCKKVEEVLEVSLEAIQQQLTLLIEEKRVFQEKGRIWLKVAHVCEQGIARELARLVQARCSLREVNSQEAISWAEKQLKMHLADNQKEAVAQALKAKVLIITGGPGTGKSTITKMVLEISRHLTSRICLAAPTGRAAKRLSQVTRREAKTLHSLLEWGPELRHFKRGRDYPLLTDLLIVDEASMIDQYLMYSLLRAVPDHTRVIFIGDVHQLPSVGPGNVLKDLIASQLLPVVTLTEIFRQAKGSKIVTNAHRIQQGQFPSLAANPQSDFFFVKAEETEDLVAEVLTLVSKRLPNRYRFDPFEEIQVLVPMKRGKVGAERLNLLLQQTLNPSSNPLEWGNKRFCVGDKVMQIKNNYDKEVFNGDVGRITSIDLAEQELAVTFDHRLVLYSFCDLDELVLAYAVSVHKYQGSECPCVVIPIHTSHFMLLHRNLLYTAVTRGKRLVVLVGMMRAIAIAVQNNQVQERHTDLQSALRTHLDAIPPFVSLALEQ